MPIRADTIGASLKERIESIIARAIKQVPHRNSPLSWSLIESRDLKGLIQLAGAALAHSREVEKEDCNCQVCWAIQEVETGIKRGRPVQDLEPANDEAEAG